MIDLEDLPRMQSLSPVKDIESGYNITSTPLNPKKPPKACRPLVTTKLLIKPTVASTPAKPLPAATTTTTTTITTTTVPSESLETPTVQRTGMCFGFNYNTLVRQNLLLLLSINTIINLH
ncbi:hypothetical protein KR222_009165, partial [Zaprionus bogoriensis]